MSAYGQQLEDQFFAGIMQGYTNLAQFYKMFEHLRHGYVTQQCQRTKECQFVNHDDEKIKTNRKNLIGLVYQGFKNIADIKEITI